MKRSVRTLMLLCLTAALLTVTAFADMGPKPQLVVRVKNAPAEPYYLDILAEGDYDGDGFDGVRWSYNGTEAAALDEALLTALRAAIPEGWHGCVSQGSAGAPMWGDLYPEEWDGDGNPLHTFGYHGVPRTYRILMVTASGETYLSGVLQRQALQCSATVDWAARAVTTPSLVWACALQFLSTLLPTLALELALLAAFRLWNRRNLLVFALTNLATQGALWLFLAVSVVRTGAGFGYALLLVPAEAVILLAEAAVYRRFFAGCTPARATGYAAAANLCSALAGYAIMEPVWRFVVSIS
ncbi:hypothetical protein [Dysosmobacter sp.]|uniref:hypothetical protein n=1 Tax=Dysosmobacter sp. TaxID=2591382 RepID=UPI002A8842A3|nr:hypothetical protein [Dysosmobacter sp.]MDY3282053.1 hypothetical protein [Dysosmobacter sp.]